MSARNKSDEELENLKMDLYELIQKKCIEYDVEAGLAIMILLGLINEMLKAVNISQSKYETMIDLMRQDFMHMKKEE